MWVFLALMMMTIITSIMEVAEIFSLFIRLLEAKELVLLESKKRHA